MKNSKKILYVVISVLLWNMQISANVQAQAPAALPTTPQISCPVVGGKIITPSYQQVSVNGHCGSTYGYSCSCNNGRRAKAIDVATTPDTDVVLPTVGGSNITWRLAETLCAGGGTFPNCTDSNGGTGGMLTFIGTDPSIPADKWYIQFVHLKIDTLAVKKGESYPAGTVVGKTDSSAHVHTTIGKNLSVNGDDISGSANCDNNWLPTDFICDPSKQPPQTTPISSGKSSGQIQSNYACTKVGTPIEEMPPVCKNQPALGAAGNLTYYCQGDSKWGDPKYACGVGQVGCGPTSIAMIFSFFGDNRTPLEVFETYKTNNLLSCGSGSFPSAVNSWLKTQGYEVGPDLGSSGELDAVAAKTYLDKGYLILGSSNSFKGQTGSTFGHIFVVQNVDPNTNTFIMRDPENCNYGPGTELTQNNVQPIISSKIPNWAYAYPIKRMASTNQKNTGNGVGGNVQ